MLYKKNVKNECFREREPMGYVHIQRDIQYKKLAHVVIETRESKLSSVGGRLETQRSQWGR